MVPKVTQIDTSQVKPDDGKPDELPRDETRDRLRPELREAIDESWKLHEAAYRYLGR